MKIAVIGAGVVGITSAYELTLAGHQVTVFERHGAAAEESSFANGGIFAPGYLGSVAEPGATAKILKQCMDPRYPLRLGLPVSMRDIRWMGKFFNLCSRDNFAINQAQLQKLAVFSRARMQEVSDSLQVEHEQGEGLMVILRSEKEALNIKPKLDLMRAEKIVFQEITSETARKLELALNPDTPFYGAIQIQSGGVGNCRQFAVLLKKEAQRLGASFVFNAPVQDIDASSRLKLQIANDKNSQSFDSVLVCAGMGSSELLRRNGLKMPLTSIYGYSISANVRELLNAPRSAIFDERFKVSVSRQGNRVRVSGGSEIGGNPARKHEKTIKILYKVLQDWFPGAANLSLGVQVWKGARATLPDGLPLIGASGIPGLWLNFGHGSDGWALSCGSAKLITEMMSSQNTGIDVERFGLKRLVC